MDSPLKKRRFWQLHLSTAVLLMFAASVFVWVNFTPMGAMDDDKIYGWPVCYCWRDYPRMGWKLVTDRIVIDIAFAVSVLLNIALISEILIRRREDREP